MKQKFSRILLTIFMLTASLSIHAEIASGTCGDNLKWTLSDDYTLTISGSGNMTNWECCDYVPWYSYRDKITKIDISSSVTNIGSCAFQYCSKPTYVNIPNSVTSIGDWAFDSCVGLIFINIPNSVTSIGARAFSECTGMSYAHIPSSVTSIGINAFYGCSSLPVEDNIRYAETYLVEAADKTQSTYNIKDGTKWIGASAFSGCENMTSINIPNSVSSIGSYAFEYCHKLTSVNIPSSITKIEKGIFEGCSNLVSVTIPECVASIGESSFRSCTNLVSVNIPSSVSNIGEKAFEGCTSLTSINIPSSITNIEYATFSECSSLVSVNIPNSVTNIGESAFELCQNLTTINIPNSVKRIGRYAFFDCDRLSSIDIPNSVTSIGYCAFYDSKLQDMYVHWTVLPDTIGEHVFSDQVYYHAKLYVPKGTWVDYAYSDKVWYEFINIREASDSVKDVSASKAYNVMNKDFKYIVYDAVNNKLAYSNSTSIAEDNTNQSWQMVKVNGQNYLYNLGAKKFVKEGADGLILTDNIEPLSVKQGEDAIKLGNAESEWHFVSNDVLSANENLEALIVASRHKTDVTGDGKVNVADVTQMIVYIMEPDAENVKHDVNGDGVINIADVTAIINDIMSPISASKEF